MVKLCDAIHFTICTKNSAPLTCDSYWFFFFSQWKALTEKRVSTSGGQDLSYADPTPNRRDGGDYKHSDFIPDGAHELLQCSNTPTEDEIFWCASDEEGNVK